MIATSETKKKKAKQTKEADLPCIYGADVIGICPVRQTLDKQEDPFKKNMMSKLPVPGIEEMMDSLAEKFDSKTHALAAFCAECPHLMMNKAVNEAEFFDSRRALMRKERRTRIGK